MNPPHLRDAWKDEALLELERRRRLIEAHRAGVYAALIVGAGVGFLAGYVVGAVL